MSEYLEIILNGSILHNIGCADNGVEKQCCEGSHELDGKGPKKNRKVKNEVREG